jgi:hypothetical protein
MQDKFISTIQKEIEDTKKEFEKAKQSAIKELQTMSIHMATDFGAAYATHIDKVTYQATKIKTLYETLDAYKYINKLN